MKKFTSERYDYEYTGEGKSEESEEEDEIPTFLSFSQVWFISLFLNCIA